MSAPFFNNISKDINTLINSDYYHNQLLALDLSTIAKNGVKFDIKSKQLDDKSGLSSVIETKYADKVTNYNLTQSWSNSNNLVTKVELNDFLTKGLKTELVTSLIPSLNKNVNLIISFQKNLFTARGNFDLLNNKPSFTGDFTVANSGLVGGLQFKYDITQGSLANYAVGLNYNQLDYSLGLAINNKNLTTLSFFQTVSPTLQVGAKAITNLTDNTNVNVEFATKYLPDETSQVKAKIQDNGIVALAYKQQLKKGIHLGVGTSFNALNLNEPVHKLGGSLSFSA